MRWLAETWRRVSMLLRGSRFDRELQTEMQLHRDLREREQLQRGLAPRAVRESVGRGFGNSTLISETSRDAWGWRLLDNFAHDLRFGARSLLRTPGFAAVAILTLALGIGANTAIFSVVDAILLRPLAYKNPDSLVTILHDGTDPVSAANYFDWRDQSRSFETMAAADFWTPNLTGSDPPEHLWGLKVTQNLFPMLGVDPMLGRLFVSGEDAVGADREVILGYRLWRRRFAADAGILGKTIILDGEAYTVVGVMPHDFKFAPFWATHAELWVPNALADRATNRTGNHLRVFARLRPEDSLAQARMDIAGVTARLEKQFPGTNRRVAVTPLKENVVGDVQTPLLVLLGAVGFVLLIACVNVAHMLLARTSDRQKEIAVRSALGAGRARMARQFLTENLLLAVIGSGIGLLLAVWATKALVALAPANLPRVELVTIDGRVISFLLCVAAVTTFAFVLAPATQAAAGNLSGALKEGTRGGSDGVRRNRLRAVLVASEFALAFMLLIGAGLMVRSFAALEAIDPGFNPHGVISMVVSVAGTQEAAPGKRAVFYRELLQRVRALPGVEAAGAINHLPIEGDMWGWTFAIEGRPKSQPGESPSGVYRIVMPGYFQTMRLPVLRGREIAESDDARAPGVVMINDRAAKRYWPGEDPIGKRVTFDDDNRHPPTWLTVIGIVKDAKQDDWAAKPYPEVYLAALQNRAFLESSGAHMAYITLVAQTVGDPSSLAPAVKNTVWSFDHNLPVSEVVTMDEVVSMASAQPRFEMTLLAGFAAVALILAAVGIYGVMNYAVSRRTREIGIRMSLGASRAEVLRMVVKQGMAQAAAGSMAGIAGALALSRFMGKMLYGVRPTDMLTFCGVTLVLASVACVAVLLPARRAMSIEPIAALRHE